MAAYRADIEIGVRGILQINSLKQKIEQVSAVVDRLNNQTLGYNVQQLKRSQFFVEQERKLIAARKEYNKGLEESIRLAVTFDQQVRQSYAFALRAQQTRARTLPGSTPAGLLPSQAASTPFRKAEQRAARLDSAYARLAAAAEGTTTEFVRIGQEGRRFKSLPAAGEATVNYFQIAQTAARVIDQQNAASARYTAALAKLAAAAEGTVGNFVRFNAGMSVVAGLLPAAQGGQKALPPGRIAGLLPPAGRTTATGGALAFPASVASTGTAPSRSASMAAATRRRGSGFNAQRAISDAIIGGSFPLLFGQGGGAAIGGAVGGVAGSALLGPAGGFAGSLLGTLVGDIASQGQQIKQLGEDIGFSARQAENLATAFKTANTDIEKFTAVVQNVRGVGLDLEDQADAINLITALTEKYGGTWDKIGNAITSSLESGKVTQASLNQLTSQGITIQDALAKKYGVSRDAILQMAKDGNISVQALLDTLVDLGNTSTTAAKKMETPFQKAIGDTVKLFQDFWSQVQTIFSGVSGEGSKAATVLVQAFNTWLKEVLFPIGRLLARIAALLVNVVSTGVNAAADLVTGFRGVASAIADAVMNIINMIPGLRTIVGLASQLLNKVAGRRSGDWNDMPWPEGVPKPGTPGVIGRITAPSQFESGGGKGTDKAAKDAERLEEQRRKQLEIAARLAVSTDTQVKKAAAINEQEKLTAELDQQRMERMVKYETLYKDALSNAEIEYLIIAQTNEITAEKLNYEKALLDIALQQSDILNGNDPLSTLQQEVNLLAAKVQGKEEEYLRQQEIDKLVSAGVVLEDAIAQVETRNQLNAVLQEQLQLEQLIAAAGQGLGDALLNVFDAVITGADNLNEVLRNTMSSLGRFLMMTGLNALADIGDPSGQGTGILSFLGFGKGFGKRAGGGAVSTGSPYIVGERGPELFVPGTGGSVVPTNDLRAAMGAAPGSSGGSPVLNMSFESTNIGGVEYVSRDQLEQAMAATRRQAAKDGAKRGMSMTLDRLQQSPQTRRRVGI